MNRVRVAATVLLLTLLLCTAPPALSAQATAPADAGATERIAPGIEYRAFDLPTPHGPIRIHLLTVHLQHPGVRAGLLYPGAVADRAPVSVMADRQGAAAAVNGDFFNITEGQHPGVPATGAASGAAVLDGRALKAAVPEGQRFGGALPPGDSGEDVVGVGVDGRARTARLTLRGHLRTPHATLPVRGLNQYALPEGAIGLFTHQWGSTSRARAVCGTDRDRAAPCTHDTFELTIRQGRVQRTSTSPGSGPIPPGTIVALGREGGAQALRSLAAGTRVDVGYRLASTSQVPFTFALGAYRVLGHGRPLPGLDATTAAPRTAVGLAGHGHVMRLVATDGRESTATGLTLAELARLLRSLDCDEGVYVDGGASTTLVTRDPATGRAVVRNTLDQGQERRVPNGIALFSP
ncbi:phosphodiester glycosidase family protein [Streptomyces sp. NBC_00083]|uniref:phosphodiester glycosidase family protein n=1 Tax=Streptomyces sp. NBC_00083 TaxID=2975647 RepID=UPI00225AA32A|nr:phosphodiester glycosidase family protein [Streptomyces sp. NBC_00083]MCX5387327.1 phosphodiester glycosidase family protein [Streptomyces sp. NBC_00083]